MRRLLVLLLFISCNQKTNEPAVVIWDNNKAIAVSIDRSLADSLSVFVKGSQYAVLGDLTTDGPRYIFTPAVPFERGQTYEIFNGTKPTATFDVPADTTLKAPVLMATYPSCDTVPANLLKIYLQFSEPMMEGRSSQFVQLYDNTSGDTVTRAFLDLQPELWNDERTVLTLWLDPGRIKQDLIPNKQLGVVLNENRTYRLGVTKGWRSQLGVATTHDYARKFFTVSRDVRKPDPKKWSIQIHGDTVIVNTKETVDWSLLNSAISIWSGEREVLSKSITERCERRVMMIPVTPLTPGTYVLKIEARLEDPAGNNLNRLFETDVTDTSDISENHPVYTITFNIN